MGRVLDTLRKQLETESLPPFVCAYPPRSAYVPAEAPESLTELWERDRLLSGNDVNIYVHVPFCAYKCGFCNLYTAISTEAHQHELYIDAVCRQLHLHESVIGSRRIRTVYIGGGTPTLVRPDILGKIFRELDILRPTWRSEAEEVAIEASPDSLAGPSGEDYAKQLVALGVDRVNLGVQSLQSQELRDAGRAHAGPAKIREAIHAVRNARVRNLSTDLIIGFDGQSDSTWTESVLGLLEVRPETISTYFLTIRPDAWFIKTGRYEHLRSRSLYRRYDFARDLFLKAGYVQESNVRYILPGLGGYRQKTLHFAGVPVIGIGAGARSYTNTNDYLVRGGPTPSIGITNYIEAMEAGILRPNFGFVFNDEERIRKRLALDLFDLNLPDLDLFGRGDYAYVYEPVIAAGIELGLIAELEPARFKLTAFGLRHRDTLSWAFFSKQVKDRDAGFYAALRNENV